MGPLFKILLLFYNIITALPSFLKSVLSIWKIIRIVWRMLKKSLSKKSESNLTR